METTIRIKEQALVLNSAQAAKLVMKVLEAAGVKASITMQVSKNRKNLLLSELMLSVRSEFALKRACDDMRRDYFSTSVAEFTKHYSKSEIAHLRNVGKKIIQELEGTFASLGYDWE